MAIPVETQNTPAAKSSSSPDACPAVIRAAVSLEFPSPKEHAAAILEAVEGEYQIALDCIDLYRQEYGETYARRLEALLTPAGEC